jgi:serralysin
MEIESSFRCAIAWGWFLPVIAIARPVSGVISMYILNGSLDDWGPETRLDTPQTGAPGYGIYGAADANSFYFALTSQDVPIRAGTTLWLDVDLDRTSGYKIWGFAGGVERRVDIDTDGVIRLYDTGSSPSAPVVLSHAFSADGKTLELAIPKDLLPGRPDQIRVFADVNDSVFLPNDYSNVNLVVGTSPPETAPPPAGTYGTVVLDGSLSDWSADTRLDTPQTGTSGYAFYGDMQAEAFLFALSSDAAPIGPGTTIWLDTDLNRDSGYKIWGFAGGSEYNINIGSDGVPRLYTGGAGETLVGDVEFKKSADGRVLEVAVPKALLSGSPSQVRVLADINDSVFIPNDYSNSDIVIGSAPPPASGAYGAVTLDGDLSDWSTASRLDTPATGVSGYAFHGDVQGGAFLFALSSDSVRIGANTTIWLDTDLNRATGYKIWGFAGGAEYNINVGPDGVPRLYTGGAGETLVGDIDYGYSADGRVLEIAVPQALLSGNPSQVSVLADINNSVYLPNDYSTANIVVGAPPPVDPGPVVVHGAVTLDGDLSDWGADTRLDTPQSGTSGYAFYGDQQGEAFVFALSSDSVKIGTNTTIWLDTDLNRDSGYKIWGLVGGAEYNINIGADGVARLYTGGAGETFVSEINYAFSADGRIVEMAVAKSLMAGNPSQVRVLADINDNVFVPNDYAVANLVIGDAPVPPPPPYNPSMRIAIVYSETTAAHYFDKTVYGQLFMSAQNQARQAGVPFDLLKEADLLDPANLVGYDAIVFPAFSHLKTADLGAITAALTTASRDYGVGLIASGNFMTNDETGAAFGDAYARMESLLGVRTLGAGQTQGFDLVANTGSNPVLDGYQPGEVVGNYPAVSYQYYGDATGRGEVLFHQVVNGTGGPVSHDAVIATTTGGRNVHFATAAVSGNANILGQAIDWAVHGDAPDVSLSMTRENGFFYARNDMDHAQAYRDVNVAEPGIYDLMLPIVQDWYDRYGFVSSYYIDIGASPPNTWTDWSLSAPYYRQLLEMGNEIGSHSYTHPFDTNLLKGDTNSLMAVLAKVDPRNPDAVDPWTLPASEQTLLYESFRFQFETSKLMIEKYLGINVSGAAVPGAPEKMEASIEMMRFYDYLSGGYSGVGQGYPGAIGYLTPDHLNSVYIAPNMSFDFTLMEFRNMTPAQAEAFWAAEYASLVSHATTPIISFPWHDYGPTNWSFGESTPKNYTKEMFESVIARAAADGLEFVTGQDLASRIAAFQNSSVSLDRDGAVLTATVNTGGAGTFALTLGDGHNVASVENWYAWNDSQVLLPRDGGVFRITTGAAPADVTRLTDLPQRADLGGRERV